MDVHAAIRTFAGDADAAGLAEAWIDAAAEFTTLDEVEAHCPPERIGLSPGRFVAVVGPLFGEFE